MSTPKTTRTWILANYPKGTPTYGSNDPNPTFKLVDRDLPELKQDQVLVKSLYFSNDPAQRPAIDEMVKAERHYTAPVKIGEAMGARALCEVIESKADSLPKGSTVAAAPGWSEYAVLDAKTCQKRDPIDGLSITHYLGALGGTGATAHYGLISVGGAKKGDRLVVTGAAGATGSMVVQIAKHIVGCSEVIGIAGSDEKCRWVESLGADKCINYKSKNFEEELFKATEGFVDIYFDNVGGHILDLMLTRVKQGGVIVACGMIAGYNDMSGTMLKNYFQVISMRLQIRGFIVIDAGMNGINNIIETLVKATKEGKIQIDDKSEHVVDTKFEDTPKTWLTLFEGGNTGKLVTKISP